MRNTTGCWIGDCRTKLWSLVFTPIAPPRLIRRPGVEPVFPEKDQAINSAQGRACFRSGEIRILDSNGTVERTIPFTEADRNRMGNSPGDEYRSDSLMCRPFFSRLTACLYGLPSGKRQMHNAQAMKTIAVIGTIVFACALASVSEAATINENRHSTKIHRCSTCTGSDPCFACKNCHYCKHCAKEGGTCGVCKR